MKSILFISLSNNGIPVKEQVIKKINAWAGRTWPDIAKSRILIGIGRLVTLFFNHLYDSRKCRSFLAVQQLEKEHKVIHTLSLTFEECLKKRWIKFHSLSRYIRCLTPIELDIWGVQVSVSKENDIFRKVKELYNSKDFEFYFELRDFNRSSNKKIGRDTWKKYLEVRLSDVDSIIETEKNKSLRGRTAAQGKPNIGDLSLEILDNNKKGILDPLSRNLAIKGFFFNTGNPYFGDSLLAERTTSKGQKDIFYDVPESYYNNWFEYIETNYALSDPLRKLSLEDLKKAIVEVVITSTKEMKKLYLK